jgi:hypothetical protein
MTNYSHDYPGHEDHEYVRHFPDYSATVRVSAVGGGTVGKRYSMQAWHYAIVGPSGKVLAHGSDLHTAMPTDHNEAAQIALDFYNASE